MRAQFVIPVLASILILGTLTLSSQSDAQLQEVMYTIDAGATITFVIPTSSAPVTTLNSDSLSGSFTIVHQTTSPFFGGEFFTVNSMELVTGSGETFSLTSVDPNEDPILASTGGVPASFLINFVSAGTSIPGIVLAGTGISPEPGFQGFSMQETGLMRSGLFEGQASDPTGFNFAVLQPFTPPGVGLYEYDAVDCSGPFGCTTNLRLFAVLNFHASVVPTSDLSLTKTDSIDPVTAGNTLTYTLTVNNAGPSDAQNVVVSDILPAGVTLVSVSSSQGGCAALPCNLGTIANGGSATVTINVAVNLSTTGTLTNTASVTSDTDDPDNSNNTATENTTSEPGAPSTPAPPEEQGPPEEPGPPPGIPTPPTPPGRP